MDKSHQITQVNKSPLNIADTIKEMNELLNQIFNWMNHYVLDYLVTEKVIKLLNDNTNPALIKAFKTRLDGEFKSKAKALQSKKDSPKIIILYKSIELFMIIVKNLNTSDKFKRIFKDSPPLIKTLKDIMGQCLNSSKTNHISKLILNLFFDEYKDLFFSEDNDEELLELYITIMSEFSSVNTEAPDYAILMTYDTLMNNIYNFNFNIDTSKVSIEEKSALIGRGCQSILEMLFSQEKQSYIMNDSNSTSKICYEIRTIQNIIQNYLVKIKSEHSEQHDNLFRKEDLYNEFIKVLFFSFGNSHYITSFFKPLKKYLLHSDENHAITIEEFSKFFNTFMIELQQSMPLIFKVVLKIVFIEINKDITSNEYSYNPLLTILIFNFFISPKTQDLYGIGPSKSKTIRELNKILRNIAFNFLFQIEDSLVEFNAIIPKYYYFLVSFLKENILTIDLENEDITHSIQSIFNKDTFKFPKVFFQSNGAILSLYSK